MMEIKNQTIDYYQHIYIEYAPMLLKFAKKFVAPLFAEDLIQDVFLKLWDKQVFLLPEEDIRRILYISVRNACIDQIRRSQSEETFVDSRITQLKLDELNYFESSEELFMKKDLMKYLLQKIEELPERSREIFRLSYLKGMKAAEIADKLNISTRTVENHLYRSLIYLRKTCSKLFVYLFLLC